MVVQPFPYGGKLKTSSNKPFTAELARSKSGYDEANGFIARMEPFAYHPKRGR